MRASNKTSNTHKTSAYEPLRLVPGKSTQQAEDIFADQTSTHAQRMRAEIKRVARRPYNILITGETGTGKTQMARQIHKMSARALNPLVELNCANLPENLVEAELFGYRKGAFTGADHDRKGLFEEADGGILFLDEISHHQSRTDCLKRSMKNRSSVLATIITSSATYRSSLRHHEICPK